MNTKIDRLLLMDIFLTMNVITKNEFEVIFPNTSIIERQATCERKKILLLGAGFSARFSNNLIGRKINTTIIEKASIDGFEIKPYIDDNPNFESFLRKIWHAKLMCETFKKENDKLEPDYFLNKYNVFRKYFIDAILYNTEYEPIREYRECIADFLKCFDDVYTVSYDPILYWSIIYDVKNKYCNNDQEPSLGDLFYIHQFTHSVTFYPEHPIFNNKKMTLIHYLHGALFLIDEYFTVSDYDGEYYIQIINKILKQKNKNLIESIRTVLEDNQLLLPCVVTECHSKLKLQQIQENNYLRFCFERFKSELEDKDIDLCVLGFNGNEEDQHLVDLIMKMNKSRIIICRNNADSKLQNTISNQSNFNNEVFIYDVADKYSHPLICDQAFCIENENAEE